MEAFYGHLNKMNIIIQMTIMIPILILILIVIVICFIIWDKFMMVMMDNVVTMLILHFPIFPAWHA